MSKIFLTISAALLLTPLLANSAYASGEDELIGLGLGATAGGLIGNQFGHGAGNVAATVGGVAVGGFAGDRIGAAMDRDDTPMTRSGGSIPLSRTGDLFDYQPVYAPNYVAPAAPEPSQIYMDGSYGDYCREISEVIQTGSGLKKEIYGTACLQQDGSWRVMP